ncbi:hypothetical protein [Brochothrix phage ADU4]|nr:hypothetical protein [Brochothrix phage ADU4]
MWLAQGCSRKTQLLLNKSAPSSGVSCIKT